MSAERKARRVKNVPLPGIPEYGGFPIQYFVPCPQSSEKSEIGRCNGCFFWLAFGVHFQKVTSPGGKDAHESVPMVECSYLQNLSKEEQTEFGKFYREFYNMRPEVPLQEIYEVDEIIQTPPEHLQQR